jgi:hypothetical protein
MLMKKCTECGKDCNRPQDTICFDCAFPTGCGFDEDENGNIVSESKRLELTFDIAATLSFWASKI